MITLAEEAGGHTATCDTCGWLTWREVRAATERAADDHKCRRDDLCFHCGGGRRLKDDGCPHQPTEGRKTP